MTPAEIRSIFDQQAASYDQQWARTAPIRDALLFLLEAVLAGLPAHARLLCVGAGTGEEVAYLAQRFPQWRFAVVEPSGAMVEVCRAKAQRLGFADRCEFHAGYLDTLPASAPFDAATCFLVSQFILDRDARSAFFRGIAQRLVPGGVLASSDLAGDVNSDAYASLLRVWVDMMTVADVTPERVTQMRAAYARDVAVLPPGDVAALIESGGFAPPVLFYQAGLIHAWYSQRP
ncbi:class I SAM-dependent methyltransferase [Diaphorobacter nitroreducens]|uniref:class I SAM-dependent methyltransferase n=1 Tax=Diaphorobacter nitroreducens TaxID=164759 RepID=UPI0035AE135A